MWGGLKVLTTPQHSSSPHLQGALYLRALGPWKCRSRKRERSLAPSPGRGKYFRTGPRRPRRTPAPHQVVPHRAGVWESHTHTEQKSIAWTLNKLNIDAKCQQHITGRQKPFANTSSTLLLWSVGWLVGAFPISRAPPDSLPSGIKVKANLAFDNDSSPLSGRKLFL